MEKLLELADRCEDAPVASKELGLRMFAAVYGREYRYQTLNDEGPRFTDSLDAAVQLVPDGLGDCLLSVMLQRTWEGRGKVKLLDSLGGQQWDGDASSPALALCAAALRARAAIAKAGGVK